MKYQPLIQEDLNVGTERVWITAPAGGDLRSTQIGLHSVARGQIAYTAAWTPGAIADEEYATTTVSVPDAAVGDLVMVSCDKILATDLRISGRVSVAGTVTIILHNPTAATITVPASTVSVLVFPVTVPTTGRATGTVYYNNTNPGNEVGAGVTVEIVALSLSTTTDDNGQYTLTGVTPGLVTVAADDGGGNTGSNTGTVSAGGVVAIDVVISGI